jgi:hypothetical protein
MAGPRRPIAAILLLIALFTSVSGKPLGGFLMLAVAGAASPPASDRAVSGCVARG